MPTRLPRPLLLFDGDCGFCRYWVERGREVTGDSVDYAPAASRGLEFPQIPPERFDASVALVETDGSVTYAAEACFRTLAHGGRGLPLALYRRVPGVAWVTETGYRLVARHRTVFSRLTRILMPPPAGHAVGTWLFLRALGLVALVAFLSLWSQIHGLAGSQGILSLAPWLERVKAANEGKPNWAQLPVLFWWGAGDRALDVVCAVGTACAALLCLGFVPVLAAAGAWACYLSLTLACRDFLTFQWDMLLLECLLLAVFVSPLQLRPRRAFEPRVLASMLLWWTLVRLMFMSGVVKLKSGDSSWWDLTAMTYHYETQPIPAPLAWHVHHLPVWFHRLETGGTFVVELAWPFLLAGRARFEGLWAYGAAPWLAMECLLLGLVVASRRLRNVMGGAFLALQAIILSTGNYGFFNLLTAALALPLLHDSVFPARFRALVAAPAGARPPWRWSRLVLAPVAAFVLTVTTWQLLRRFDVPRPWPPAVTRAVRAVAPFQSLNAYGLFSVMTKTRPTVLVEGSDDGTTWKTYGFKYAPVDPMQRPRYFVPHMPRLDWRMWFAALGSERQSPWYPAFTKRLLEGSPDVLSLMGENPFPDHPPQYVRSTLWMYRFSTPEERAATGVWWVREQQGVFLPPLALSDFRR